jgi:6-phosphogluconolactonase
VIFLATGAGKREAIQQWRSGAALPAAAIVPPAGVEVFMDAAAEPVA